MSARKDLEKEKEMKRDFDKLVEQILEKNDKTVGSVIQFMPAENKYIPITTAKVDAWLEEDDNGDIVTRIDNIEVPKSKRYKGEGTKEVKNIIKWSKKNGSKGIVVESERSAIPFWKKMGFDINDQGSEVSTGTLQFMPAEGEDSLENHLKPCGRQRFGKRKNEI